MSNLNRYILTLSWGVALIIPSLLYYQSTFYFNHTPWDGTFQTLFPLLKMDNGFYPGRDFFYFHGNGIPYLIYPLYHFFNSLCNLSTIVSALTSTFIINLMFLVAPFYLLIRKVFDIQVSSALTIFFLALSNYIPYTGGYLSPLFLGAPMGIRFSPHLIMALVVFNFLSGVASFRTYLYFGFIASTTVLLAAEQGFYAVGGALIVIFIYTMLVGQIKNSFVKTSICLMSFIFLFVLSNYIAFGGLATFSAIKSISNDQSWVFGVFPNKFYDSLYEVFSFKIIDGIPSQITTMFSFVLSIFVFLLLFLKKIDAKYHLFLASVSVLFFGSLLSWASNIGYIGAHQAALNIRYIYIIIGFLAVLVCTDWKNKNAITK
ncbi:hypothetical protein ACET9I_21815 [Aeromonas veronii]